MEVLESPYIGGDANSKDWIYKVIFYTLITIIICVLLWKIFMRIKTGENDNQRALRHAFMDIHGEEFDDTAKEAIRVGETINNPRAIDHYRLGTVYLVNARNPAQAHRHFTQALEQIIGGMVDPAEAPFIIERIDDFKDHFVDFPEMEDLPLMQAITANFEHMHEQLNQVRQRGTSPAVPNADDPEFEQKLILSRQHWQGDSQNVHDSAMYKQLCDQYNQVRMENLQIPGIEEHTFEEAKNWLIQKFHDQPENLNYLHKYLEMAERNDEVPAIPNCREKDLLLNAWRRTFDPRNRKNAGMMRDSIADAILDTIEGGVPVCMSGRSKKLWQGLARVDCDPEIGVLKTKQALRNEIYQKCAKVVDDFIGENGTASDVLKEAYAKSEDTEQVQELKTAIKNRISEVVNEYSDEFDRNTLNAMIIECQAVVDL